MLNQGEFLVLCLPDKLLFWFALRRTKVSCALGGCLAASGCCSSREGVTVYVRGLFQWQSRELPCSYRRRQSLSYTHCKCSGNQSNARQNGWAAVLYKNDLNPALILFLRISLKSLLAPSWRLSGAVAVGRRVPGPRLSCLPGDTELWKTNVAHARECSSAGSALAGPCVSGVGMDTVAVSLRSRSLLPGERLLCWCPPQGAGGQWHLGQGDAHLSANGRAVTINMSELLRAVNDCSIDFSAQLFSCVLARAISQCCRSCARALTPFPQLACANAELHVGITPKWAASGEAELHVNQQGKGVRAPLPAFFHPLVMD